MLSSVHISTNLGRDLTKITYSYHLAVAWPAPSIEMTQVGNIRAQSFHLLPGPVQVLCLYASEKIPGKM